MITVEKTFPNQITYPLSRLADLEKTVFFDIETTGFSPECNPVYLIGCLRPNGDSLSFHQWFAETPEEEPALLIAFFDYIKNDTVLIHFNGDRFDIPFLTKRALLHHIPTCLDSLTSIDLFRQIRPFKKLLQLPDAKLKTIEQFLGIYREDCCNGGELIPVYLDYVKTRDSNKKHLLMLHNEEDITSMPALLPILFYPDFFEQTFFLKALQTDREHGNRLILDLEGDPVISLPVPVCQAVPSYGFAAEKNRMEISVHIYQGTLKYYHPDYKNYYYLVYEDTAIHKSVGEFVDKSARTKATRETCYTKKDGIFLPQPSKIWEPEFKLDFKDKSGFFQMTEEAFSDPEKLNSYIRAILSLIIALP